MFDNAAREFLQKTLIARLSVIDPEGYPHTVPVWFMLEGDDIIFIAERSTRKVGYIQHNSKAAVTIGGDSEDGGGYLIKGEIAMEEDPGLAWMRKVTYHYEEPEQAAKDCADWAELDMIVLRLRPRRVIKVA
jgi:general stress protein 26